jgi:hypothetical protein
MADYFADSSALVKRYVRETGSTWIESLFDPEAGHEVYVSVVTPVEIIAALTRRGKGGTIRPADAQLAIRQFRADLKTAYQVVELTPSVIQRSIILAETRGLRGYDAIQLASALETNALLAANGLPSLTFVSADLEVNSAALGEGLTVEDPNRYP